MAKSTKRKKAEQRSTPAPISTTKRIKVQAQRKFAQGAPIIPIHIPKESYSSSGPSSTRDAIKETPIFHFNSKEEKTYTEDFLTFLCFKGSNRSRTKPAFPFTFQTRLFVPNGVRKQATETPAPAPPVNLDKSTSSAASQTKAKNSQNAPSAEKKLDSNGIQTRSKSMKYVKRKNIEGRKIVGTKNKTVVKVTSKQSLPSTQTLKRKIPPANVKKIPVAPVKKVQSQPVSNPRLLNTKPQINKTQRKPVDVITKKQIFKTHYITRRTLFSKEVNSAGKTIVCTTRSGFVRRVVVPLKKKPPQKKEFSSDDDEPLYKTVDTSSKSQTSKASAHNTRSSGHKVKKTTITSNESPKRRALLKRAVLEQKKSRILNKNKKPATTEKKINDNKNIPTSIATRSKDTSNPVTPVKSIGSNVSKEQIEQKTVTPKTPKKAGEDQSETSKKDKRKVTRAATVTPRTCKNTSIDSNVAKSVSSNNSVHSKVLKRTRSSATKLSNASEDDLEVAKKKTRNSSPNKQSDIPGASGVATRSTRNQKLTENNSSTLVQKNVDQFTDSDEEPLVSKISDTVNSKNVNNPTTSSTNVETNPRHNNRLSVLIDNETREMADRHSQATIDSIDSSFNLNNGGNHSRTSSSSADESANVTVQPETEPPIENLLNVIKRNETVDNEKVTAPNECKEDETLQQSLESYIKNNSDADRNKKFLKTKEYIDNWIMDSARLSSSPLFLRWLLSTTSPNEFTELRACLPQFLIENLSDVVVDDFEMGSLDLDDISKYGVFKQEEPVIPPASVPEPVKQASKETNTVEIPQVKEKTEVVPSTSQETPPITKKTPEDTKQTDVPSQMLSGDQSFDVYDFDSETELSTHNALEELSWKPKRYAQRPQRPIPSYSEVRKNNKIKQSQTKATIANCIPGNKITVSKTTLVPPAVNVTTNNVTETNPSSTEQKNNPEGHMFFIPLDGINKSGAPVENMIGGVAVKVGAQEGPDRRVIMTAKLVTKSVLEGSKNTSDSLANKTGPVRDMVNSVLPAGFKNTFTPVNVTVAEHSEPMPAADESVQNAEVTNGSRSLSSPLRNLSHVTAVPNLVSNPLFPTAQDTSAMVDAPVFRPTEHEFQDPLDYIEKITPIASKYGICKIIPPPSFQSECNIWEDMRFTPHNQYVHRMLHRWGPSSRQMCAIKKYLSTQGVTFTQPPKLSGIEVDLPKLYHVVQSLGGLKRVLEKKLWMRVAEEMSIPFNAHYMDFRLDEIYCKYLLPYDTLSTEERQKLLESVDKQWELRHEKLIARAANPMNCQEDEDDGDAAIDVTEDIEECVTRGKSITLGSFARLAKNIISMHFGKLAEPSPDVVEKKFWEYVTNRKFHICVNSGSIDSSVWGYGFPSNKVKGNNIAKHPWNLKVLTNNSGSVLRSLGPMVGVTAPTLHVGMAFSACCWYRDPHGLPWIEYLHQGAPKVWYGVPASHGQKFRSALASIVPGLCQQKTIWLLSDTAMVPPSILTSNGVSLCRTLQQPGEFVIVFPKAFSSNICTGYSVSESVYFALHTWLQTAHQDFTDIRNSCEPSMFSLERLMVAISEDQRSSYQVLKQVLPALNKITQQEKQHRETLFNLGLKTTERAHLTLTAKKKMAQRQDEAEECQRCRMNLSLSMLYHSKDNSAFCLSHGAEYLEANRDQVDNCKLIFMHSIEELQTIMSKLIQRINNLANKKTGKGKNQ